MVKTEPKELVIFDLEGELRYFDRVRALQSAVCALNDEAGLDPYL